MVTTGYEAGVHSSRIFCSSESGPLMFRLPVISVSRLA